MKKLLTSLFLASLFFDGNGQNDESCYFNFENTDYCHSDYLYLDTISDTNNIWQIGHPQKAIFNSAYSSAKAIVTDTINPYTINDTSSFTIVHHCMGGFSFESYLVATLSASYRVDCDSLNDFGRIEFSPDNGNFWIDLLNDTVYEQYIVWDIPDNPKPTFTGNSQGWKYFSVNIGSLGPVFNIQPFDTVLYRFTFISDSIEHNRDGLMFDAIDLYDYAQSISEFSERSSTLYPNPATHSATLEFENPTNTAFNLQFFDITGRVIMEQSAITTDRITLNTQHLPAGIYHYRLMAAEEKLQSFGKLIIY